MRLLNGLFVFLIFTQPTSCSTDRNTYDINGHWHAYSEDNPIETLDIKDSVVSTNKFKLINENGYQYDFSLRNFDIRITENTLQVFGEDGSHDKYVKSDVKNCILTDRYSDVVIDISLAKADTSKSYDSICKKYGCGNFFIGKLKDNSTPYINNLRSTFPDSIFIQTDIDELVNLNKMQRYASLFHTHINAPEGRINLHIDEDVPTEFIDRVRDKLKHSNVLIQDAVKSKSGDIGLVKIKQ